jgi:sulfite exporter TauE/SafE
LHLEPISIAGLFGAALSSAAHCAGMCGGFAMACASAPSRSSDRGGRVGWSARFARQQALYHVGKTLSYLFIGSLAAAAVASLARSGGGWARGMSVLAGLLFVVAGLDALGFTARRAWASAGSSGKGPGLHALGFRALPWKLLGAGLLNLRSPLAPLYLGLFNGFVPCPIVYAFAARAAVCSSWPEAMAVMAALAAGTIPALTAAVVAGAILPRALHARLAGVSSVILIALGAWTLYRGVTEPSCCATPPFSGLREAPP